MSGQLHQRSQMFDELTEGAGTSGMTYMSPTLLRDTAELARRAAECIEVMATVWAEADDGVPERWREFVPEKYRDLVI